MAITFLVSWRTPLRRPKPGDAALSARPSAAHMEPPRRRPNPPRAVSGRRSDHETDQLRIPARASRMVLA